MANVPLGQQQRDLGMTIDRRTVLSSAIGMLGASIAPRLASAAETQARDAAPSNEPGSQGVGSAFVEANGIKLHYRIAGSGPAVILLHGWPQTSFAWIETISALKDRYTVIAPDLRGTGLSERPAAGYDKKTIAEDVAALIQKVGGGRAVVVGHDMGGKAAYVLAQLRPEVVSKLCLVDCLIPGTENTDALHGGAWHYGFHAAADFPEMLTAGRERDYIRAQIKAWSHRKDAISEAAITEYARHYATPGGMTAGFNYYRALPQDFALVASFGARKLTMPVLTVAGQYSAGSKLADAVAPQADQFTSVIVEGSGHFVAEEAPEAFVRALRQFLES